MYIYIYIRKYIIPFTCLIIIIIIPVRFQRIAMQQGNTNPFSCFGWLAGWLAQANHHNNNDQSNKSHLDDEAEGKSKCLGHMPFSTPFLYHLWTDANNTLNGFR
jgi:hypothetical protein